MSQSEIIIYRSEDGQTKIQTRLENETETVWLSQKHMAELFQKGDAPITEHINNIFKEGELQEDLVCWNFRHTTQHSAIGDKHREGKTNR